MKNILVFPCGSEIALDIYSSVKYSTYFHLIGASSVDDHGQFVYEDYISGLPYATDKDFVPALKRIVKERSVDAIYPAMDLVIPLLKEVEDELGCMVISSSLETTKICLSKELTYHTLQHVVRTPRLYSSDEVERYPVFVKPKIGYGAKGTCKINSRKELDSFIAGKDGLLICEYLPGEEYTVDCFTDKDGCLLYSAARKRNRVKDGISVNTFFVEQQEEFEMLAQKMNASIRFRGAWFYQVKRNRDGELCLLEIASRLGGSSLLSRAVGVNFALLSLFDAFGYKVSILKNEYKVELDRALESRYKTDIVFDTVYVDYDDCLLLNASKVNTELVAFLFKCINEKKRVVLLTKHIGDLPSELKKYRIESLFDEVIHIAPEGNKSDYIKEDKAIFIDDSHAERHAVKTMKHLPVFSPDMIDVLQ